MSIVPTCFNVSLPHGAINSIMAELIEDHIHNHMPRDSNLPKRLPRM